MEGLLSTGLPCLVREKTVIKVKSKMPSLPPARSLAMAFRTFLHKTPDNNFFTSYKQLNIIDNVEEKTYQNCLVNSGHGIFLVCFVTLTVL